MRRWLPRFLYFPRQVQDRDGSQKEGVDVQSGSQAVFYNSCPKQKRQEQFNIPGRETSTGNLRSFQVRLERVVSSVTRKNAEWGGSKFMKLLVCARFCIPPKSELN